MKQRILRNCVYSILISLSMISCKKDSFLENENTQLGSEKRTSGANFADLEDYNRELKKVLTLDGDKLSEWQQQQPYTSFGIECKLFYSQINPDSFKSQDEIFEFVKKNNKYIRLVVDEKGDMIVENQLEHNPNRYFISKEKIFTIGNTAYKCFNEGMISTSMQNMEELKKIENIEELSRTKSENSIFSIQYFSQHTVTKGDYGRYLEDHKDNGRDRTKFIMQLYYTENNNAGVTYLEYTIQPLMKTLGVYFGCFRKLSADISAAYYFRHSDPYNTSLYIEKIPTVRHQYQSTEAENKKVIIASEGSYKGTLSHLTFYYSDSWASTLSAPRCEIQRGI